MKYNKLYGKSTTGKIKTWSIEVSRLADGTAYIEIEHGYIDGKKQVETRMVEEGKNIGKSNETTPYEQACSEAKSLFSKKIDSGYSESIDQIPSESDGFFLPMLAHRWQDHSAKINFPAVIQPKYDGFRCLAKKKDGIVHMWTRKGKPIDATKEIKEELSKILADGESTDGELYRHGWGFQRVSSAIKKRGKDTSGLHYYIYDAPDLNKSFKERFIDKWLTNDSTLNVQLDSPVDATGCERLKVVPTACVNNKDELAEYESLALENGFEGIMVRNVGGLYMFKNRSYDLQKVKQFEDEEYEVVGGKDGQGREAGLVIFRCKTDSGKHFDVRPKGTSEERALMFKNLQKYIGKKLTVKFQGLTDDGLPRFPVGLNFRPDWDI